MEILSHMNQPVDLLKRYIPVVAYPIIGGGAEKGRQACLGFIKVED